MDILKGLLFINDTDVFVTYGAFLAEDEGASEEVNYSALLSPPEVKEYSAVDFRELDGEKLPATLLPRFKPRDVTLQFAIVAENKAQFLYRYSSFILFLKNGVNGWLTFRLLELNRTYRFYYKKATEYKQLTDLSGEVAARFDVVFREPEPAIQMPLE